MTALLALIPWWGRLIAIGALILACMAFGAAKMHAHDAKRYDALEGEFVQFKAKVKSEGVIAKAKYDAQVKSDKEKKEKADNENAKTIASLNADIKRLRLDRAGSSFVPSSATSSSRPDLACFNRAELESAIRGFDQSLQGIVDEGSKATVDLNTAKAWAQP